MRVNKRSAATLFFCAVLAAGCGGIEIPALENITETQIPLPVITDTAQGETSGASKKDIGGPNKAGEPWLYQDGMMVSLVKLERATVPDISAGGAPGDPAVVVTIRVKNGSDSRVDISQMVLAARTGAEGIDAERVFTAGFDNPSGTLTKDRSYTFRAMFSAKENFKMVAVDVTPTWDYSTATFEDELN